MLDLSSLPRKAFAAGLEYNLVRLGSFAKVYDEFLSAGRDHLGADSMWLRRSRRESSAVSEDYASGTPAHRNDELIDAFLRREHPSYPKSVLLSPLRVHGRVVGIVGAERHGSHFERGRGWVLNRLAKVLARDLSRREDERLARVLDSIREKIVAELRPRDLAYQILDGLEQLVRYDHSGALLLYDPERGTLRVEADKISWTKSKSAAIGHEITLSPEVKERLTFPASIVTAPDDRGADTLFDLLYFHRGQAIPEPTSFLAAPLFFDGELLGVLKLAALHRLPFDVRDKEVAERFLPAAAAALRHAQERVSLENQALQAELRAGLVTLARAIAHDVNNAMGSLLPLAEQVRDDLRSGSADASTLVEDMNVVVDKAALCKRIFGNMLRLGSGRHGHGPVDVHVVLQEMMPVLRAQCDAHGVAMALELAAESPVIGFSRQHLERILWNLVMNAIEAMTETGGRIVIRTGRADPDHMLLTIANDGPDLAAAELSRVMEPFYTTKENGTGLGLSICRALAWQYGGNLTLDSASGEGVVATLSLPLERADG